MCIVVDILQRMLTATEFFTAALKQNGVEIAPDDYTKVAAARGVSEALVKQADEYHLLLAKNGVKFATVKDRAENALKLAQDYEAYVAEQRAFAAARVAEILGALKTAAAEIAPELSFGKLGSILQHADLLEKHPDPSFFVDTYIESAKPL